MENANPRALVIVSLVSGLVGGVLATFLLVGSSVIAQPTAADIPPVITAQEFRLVDTKGHLLTLKGCLRHPPGMDWNLRRDRPRGARH